MEATTNRLHIKKGITVIFIGVFMLLTLFALSSCNLFNFDNTINKNKLVVGIGIENFPYSYTHADTFYKLFPIKYIPDEELRGFDVVCAEQLCKDAGYEIEFYPLPNYLLLDYVAEHQIDIAIGNIEVNDQNKEKADFTIPYLDLKKILYITEGKNVNNLLQQKYINVVCPWKTNDSIISQINEVFQNKANINDYCISDFHASALITYEKNIDAVFGSEIIEKAIKENYNINSYLLNNGQSFPVAIAINKDIKNVKEKLNDSIQSRVNDGYFQNLYSYIKEHISDPYWDENLDNFKY